MEKMREQAERFGAEIATGEVKSVDLHARPFVLKLAEGEIKAEALIVATGARAKWLGLPEEIEFRTKIGGVSACATSHNVFPKGYDRLGVGGGATALAVATLLPKLTA